MYETIELDIIRQDSLANPVDLNPHLALGQNRTVRTLFASMLPRLHASDAASAALLVAWLAGLEPMSGARATPKRARAHLADPHSRDAANSL